MTKRYSLGLAPIKTEGGKTPFDAECVSSPGEAQKYVDPTPLMTIADLIQRLKEFPAATPVFVRGYEGGLCVPIISHHLEKIGLNSFGDSSVYGPHGRGGEGWEEPTDIVAGLVLDRSP